MWISVSVVFTENFCRTLSHYEHFNNRQTIGTKLENNFLVGLFYTLILMVIYKTLKKASETVNQADMVGFI